MASVGDVNEAAVHLGTQAVHATALMTPGEAAILAADVEAMSRTVEHLQLVCARALDTHRVIEAFGADRDGADRSGADRAGADRSGADRSGAERSGAERSRAEFRSTADYMRCRLRISRAEAQRRLRLAASLLPSTSTSGQPLPAELPALAEASARGLVSSASAAVVANAIEEIRHRTDASTASTVEADLTALAVRHDGDFLVRAARRWVLLLDQDGAEPTDEELRRFQGVFPGRKKNGLNHLNIYCTDDQHETLLTVMNAAAGPRLQQAGAAGGSGAGAAEDRAAGSRAVLAGAGALAVEGRDGPLPGPASGPATTSRWNGPTRPQRLLGGLVDAAKAALATGGVPAAGGLRPQVLVTIDSASLLQSFNFGSVLKSVNEAGQRPPTKTNPGSFAFTGPVAAATVRKLACDADLLPVVLSGDGRILDIGRAQRLFPPHLRKALHARDGGCAFPGCTIPGPWTEAHHIRHWNQGGPTATDNGVLLCSHHHHEVHKENWSIEVRSGVPWFVPPPYVDPDRIPLRNTYFRADLCSGNRLRTDSVQVS